MYGEGGAETLLGEALAAALRGPLRRDELCVISKVYPHNAGTQGVAAACERSLKRLQLDHLDLYLLHWRVSIPLAQTVEGFERLRQRGLIRHWGVSNFDVDDLQELFAVPGGMACAANQVWYSLSKRGIEFDLLPWQQQRRMPLMAYSPIDQGALSRHPGLAALAAQRGVTPAQLALAWVLRPPGVMAVPKSSDLHRLRANWQAVALSLTDDELAALDRMFPPPRRKQSLATG
jgi:diketogulonate reductase-like aldo/keto reductase